MVDHTAPVFWVTMGWILLSFHGLVLTAIALRDGVADYRWLHRNDLNGPRTIIAVAAVRNTAARFILFLAFFVIGINAIIGDTAPAVTGRAIVASALLVLTLLVKVVATHLDARDQVRLLTMLKIDRAVRDAAAA